MATIQEAKEALRMAAAIQRDVNEVLKDRSAYRRGGSRAMGFAALSLEENQEMSSKGGKAAHALGKAHKWTSGEEAQEAGRKGGSISRRRKKGGE